MAVIKETNIISGSFGQSSRLTTVPNWGNIIPIAEQNLYSSLIARKSYAVDEYEFFYTGEFDFEEVLYSNDLNAKFMSVLLSGVEAVGVFAAAIPDIGKIVDEIGEEEANTEIVQGDYYMYLSNLYVSTDVNKSELVLPDDINGEHFWELVGVDALHEFLEYDGSSSYDYYYSSKLFVKKCTVETWSHTQSCVDGKVVVSGTSNYGNTYEVITGYNCDIYTYSYDVQCRGGYVRIVKTNNTTNETVYLPTAMSCDSSSHQHEYTVELVCAENCKPDVWVARMRCTICDIYTDFETPIECCECEDTPEVDYVCDEDSGLIRINVAESECGEAYSMLTNIPCDSADICIKDVSLRKKSCEEFSILHDDTQRTYYIKVLPYEEAFTKFQLQDLFLGFNTPKINLDRPVYNLNLSMKDDGLYLAYLIWIEGEEKKAKIIPIYKTCAMEDCIEKMIRMVLCMCDCGEGNPCEPELEAQYRYELNKLMAIITPVRELMMLRAATDGQVIPFDLELLDKYCDLGLMIKKMNIMIDRCGLCDDDAILDCGCNERS